MNYLEAIKNQSESLQAATPEWMHAIQARGRALWSAQTWPGKKTEAWRYTSLVKVEKTLASAQTGKAAGFEAAVAENTLQFKEALQVVIVDGRVQSVPDTLPEGLQLAAFSNLAEADQRSVAEKLGTVVETEKHLFAVQSESLLSEGLYIKAKKNAAVSVPIYLVFIGSQAANFRVFADLEQSASLTLVEHYLSLESEQEQQLENTCTEFSLADNSQLNHYRLNMQAESALHVGGVHAALAKHARLNSFYLAFGTALTRIDAGVKHVGEGSHTNMYGVYLPRNNQHVDFHTNLEHCVPHTTSEEVFRGIVGDSARAVFNGRIHIYPQAQKTHAQLSNKNLLTSNKAEVDTKPELEIYANDVQCAHGATVAQLEEKSLHYLRTRGISEEEARVMLSFGFINELIEQLELEAIRDYLRPILAKRFARSSELSQHLL